MEQERSAARAWYMPGVEDAVWLLLFSALAWVSPTRGAEELQVLVALAVVQLAAPRVRALTTGRGNLAVILLKLVAGFLLIGVTGGIASNYYLILMLPVVSAATTLGPVSTTALTTLACAAYLVFIPMAQQMGYMLEGLYLRDLSLRVVFLPVVAHLAYTLAQANRKAALRAQAAAAELAEANRRLTEAEAGMRRSERLAALGQLTAGLAHEIRNPLGTMKASAEMLSERLPEGEELGRELAGYISSEVDRTNSLITRFLDFARPVTLRRTPTDINALVETAERSLMRQTRSAMPAIHKNFDPAVPLLDVDAELLERVVFNLLQNAMQASPEGAPVTVKTKHSGPVVEIAVLDRGSGIKESDREHIFNPFFTTKAGGVGLGLAICAKIVDEHGGRISVESELGRGSTFVVSLPASAQSL